MSDRVIPTQWMKTDLDNVLLSIVGGGTPSKANPSYYQGDIPWMSVKDMNKNVLEDTVDHISQEAVENSSTNVIPAGVPIIATRMSLGKIVVANFDTAINQDLKALFLPKQIDRNYLIWWYRSIAKDIENLGTGTTVKGVRLEVLRELQFPMAPLAEQKIIADKLDTLLAQVESIKARLERIPEILKQFRQSVLAAAVSGKLTEEWRKQNGISQPDKKKIRNIINALDQGWSPKCLNEPAGEGEWGVIKTSSIQAGFFVRAENKKLPKTLSPRNELTINKGDLLITRAGPRSRCGVTCIVDDDHPNLMICDKVYRIRVNQSEILPNFLNWCLNSPQYLLVIDSMKTGISESGMNITQQKLLELELLIPQLIEQVKVFQFVEGLFNYADSIDRQIHSALDRVNNLTPSILAKAFRGELTAEWRKANPELISGENSAEALLERIKAERTSVKSATKRGRAKT